MNLSGIIVFVRPQDADHTIAALSALPGVEVHGRDAEGRLVVVQESSSVDEEVAGLRRIQSLPSVASAELVYHYFADDPSIVNAQDRDADSGVPASLTG